MDGTLVGLWEDRGPALDLNRTASLHGDPPSAHDFVLAKLLNLFYFNSPNVLMVHFSLGILEGKGVGYLFSRYRRDDAIELQQYFTMLLAGK